MGIFERYRKWLDIDALKTVPKDGAVYWFVFGGLLVSGIFFKECLEVVLAGIREGANSGNRAGKPGMWG